MRSVLHLVTEPKAPDPKCSICGMKIDKDFRDYTTDSSMRYGTGIEGKKSCKDVPKEFLFPKKDEK